MLDIYKKSLLFLEGIICRNLKIAPRSILFPIVWITNKCNLKCKICDQWKVNAELFSKELSTEEWFSFIDSAKRLNAAVIVITGGEPFLRPDLFEIIKYIKKNKISSHICTNGTFLDKVTVNKLKEAKPDSISVSLDSYSADIHNLLRGVDCFEKVIQGIKLLKTYEPKIKVGINCAVSKKNFRDLYKMVPFAESLGVDQIKIDLIHTNLRHRNKSLDSFAEFIFQENDASELKSEIDKYIHTALRSKLLTNSATFLKGIGNSSKNYCLRYSCSAGYLSCAVDPLGRVSPCDDFEGQDSLRNKPLEEIWKSPSFNALRLKVQNCTLKCWDSTHAEVNIRSSFRGFLQEFRHILRELRYYSYK
ncbi:MAG: radical SAM protein [Candidatus Omnitrophica bacterium]|jgi:MoaA/NifB/PqqE/SkfB family radical SAM enzyme|nr:radical SAM protein [Candidatus Omnitrophota bacterium]